MRSLGSFFPAFFSMLNNGTAIKFDKYMRYHNDNPVMGTVSGGAPNGRL